jgi:hypothetical protein
VAPNGKIFFGAWNRYNYAEGRLMPFDVGGGVPTGPHGKQRTCAPSAAVSSRRMTDFRMVAAK